MQPAPVAAAAHPSVPRLPPSGERFPVRLRAGWRPVARPLG